MAPEPLVGRRSEFAVLRGAFAQALASSTGLVALTGEAGIGKTRIATEFAREARDRGARVAWGRCREDDTAPAFWPWVQALRAAAAEGGDGAAMLAALQAPQESTEASIAPRGQLRLNLFDQVATFVRRLATGHPLVLLFDDLHWADQASLLLLEFVASELADERVLLVVTYRPDEPGLRPGISALLGQIARLGRTVPLAGLALDEVTRLLTERLGSPPTNEVARTVHGVTDGNPFFVLEVSAHLGSGAALSASGFRLPLGLRELVDARLSRLPHTTRVVLDVAAVLGREFDAGVVGHVLGLEPARVLDALAPAVASGVVRAVSGGLRRHVFAHALVREAVYAALLPAARAAQHRRVGEAIVERAGARVSSHAATLAHHFFEAAKAGDPAPAVRFGRLAGDQALGLSAFEEAITHYEGALRALDLCGVSSDEEHLHLLLGLGEAAAGAGDQGRAEAVFRDAIAFSRGLGPETFARAVARYGAVHSEMGVFDDSLVTLLEEAIAWLPTDDDAVRARLTARLASALQLKPGAEVRRHALADEAATMARRLGEPPTLAYVLSHRLIAGLGPDNIEERMAAEDEILEVARAHGYREAELAARAFRVHDLLERGEHGRFRAAIDQFEAIARDHRQPFWIWHAATFRASVALIEWTPDAEALMNEALARGQRAQAQTALLHYGAQLTKLRGEQGRIDEVLPLVEMAAMQAATVPAWRCSLADLYSITGRLDDARREFEAVAADDFAGIPRDTSWLTAMTLAANVCAVLDDRRRARLLYELLAPYSGMIAASRPAVVVVQPVDTELGRLATTLRRWPDATRHFERALGLAASMNGRPWIAHAQNYYGAMLLARDARGDREQAVARLTAARELAGTLGLTLVSGWIATNLERSGVPQSPRPAAVAVPQPVVEPVAEEVEGRVAVGEGRRGAVVRLVSRGAPASARAAADRRGTFRREGDVWLVGLGAQGARLRHAVGLAHLAHLIRHPGVDIHVTDLVDLANTRATAAALAAHGMLERAGLGDAGVVLDPQAKAEYRRRVTEVREELGEAERLNDVGRVERLRAEVEFLTDELARGVGLGGRDRRAASASERARVTVTKAIRYALGKIGEHDAALTEHLETAVRTGAYCVYAPAERDRIVWITG